MKRIVIVVLTILIILGFWSYAFAQEQESVLGQSGLAAEDLNKVFGKSGLAGLGPAFIAAEQKYGIKAGSFASIAIHESGWGQSRFAKQKNNLFGFCCYDSDPGRFAKCFASKEACIDFVARYLKKEYLTEGGKYYRGTTLEAININYCSTKSWVGSVRSQMKRFETYKKPVSASAPVVRSEPIKAVPCQVPKNKEVNEMSMVIKLSPSELFNLIVRWFLEFAKTNPKLCLFWLFMFLLVCALLNILATKQKWHKLIFFTAIQAAFIQALISSLANFFFVFWLSLKEKFADSWKLSKKSRQHRRQLKQNELNEARGALKN